MVDIEKLYKTSQKILDWDLVELESVDSTNEEAKRLFKCNSYSKLIVISNEQKNGKGRYSRSWLSPSKCGLYGSWFLANCASSQEVLPLLCALVCVKSLQLSTKKAGFFVKWPNDLIFNNKKLGGILIEIQRSSVIIGIGMNIYKNATLPSTAISLEQIVSDLDKDFYSFRLKLLTEITKELEKYLHLLFQKGNKFILDTLKPFLIPSFGSSINFIKDDEIFSAKVLDLGNNGELIVELENKTVTQLRSNEISIIK